MKLSEDKFAPYVTLRILSGSKLHIVWAGRSIVFQSYIALEFHSFYHLPFYFITVFEHQLWLKHDAGAGGIKLNRTERILALVELRVCACVPHSFPIVLLFSAA